MAGETVLIVDDNEKNRRLARDVLQFGGLSTLEASTGEEAIALAVSHTPDLVLMDIRLPDMDGAAVLVCLRGDPRTETVPVVALTAYAMKGDQESLLAAGFTGYMEKPIQVKTFAKEVRRYFETDGRAAKP